MLTRRELFHAAGAATALGLTQANSAQSPECGCSGALEDR